MFFNNVLKLKNILKLFHILISFFLNLNDLLIFYNLEMTSEDDPYEFRRRIHNEERNRFNATKKELSDVTRIMISNVENVIQRGEAINSIF